MRFPLDEPILGRRERANLSECVRSGWLSWQGPFVGRLEREFAAYCGARHALAVASGSSALLIGLQALGIGRGDEVLVPSLTFSATAFAATVLGAAVRFVDCAPGSLTIDPGAVEDAVGRRTRAIVVVHLYGRPAEMDAILKIARKRGLAVVEDAAQAAGAEYKGRRVGSLGDAGCFSFHNKLIASGEGGLVTFAGSRAAERARVLRSPAPENRTDLGVVSMNHRPSNLHAAVAVAQLERLERVVASKRRIALLYERRLGGVPGIEVLPEPPQTRSVYWRYSAFVTEDFPLKRDALVRALNLRGIQARAIFSPLHLHPVYRGCRARALPFAEDRAGRGFDLPTSPKLTAWQVERVVEAVARAGRRR